MGAAVRVGVGVAALGAVGLRMEVAVGAVVFVELGMDVASGVAVAVRMVPVGIAVTGIGTSESVD